MRAIKQKSFRMGLIVLGLLGISLASQARAELISDQENPSYSDALVIAISGSSMPFAYVDDQGQAMGFNYDLAVALCEKLDAPCRVETHAFANVLSKIGSGQVDVAIANLLQTPERDKVMLFSDPIWRSTSSLIGRADLAAAQGPDFDPALKESHRICSISGSRQSAFIDGLDGPAENNINTTKISLLFDALVQGECDLAIMPTVSALQFLSSARGQTFDYVGLPLTDPQLSGTVHIAVSKQHPELVEQINAIMDEILQDGSYRAMIFRYFPFDIL